TPVHGTRGTLVGFGRSGGPLEDFGLKRTTRIETAECPADLSAPLQLCWDFSSPIGEPGEHGNTCNGDSGGPLFVDLGLGTVVAGVTSGGTTTDCLPPDESWDTNVHHFVDYVRAQAGADLDSDWCGGLSQVGDAKTTVEGFSGNLALQDEQAAHTFDVPDGTSELRVTMNATEDPGADFDLVVRATGEPAKDGYECARTGSGQWAACLFYAPPAGSWELLVQRVAGQGEYQVTATSFAPGVQPPAPGTPQSRAQQRCLKVQSKLGRKAAASEVREVRGCLKAVARGQTGALGIGSQARTAQACLTNDVRGRVARVARKAAKKDEKVCTGEPPDFGYSGADAVVDAPIEQIAALVGELFGTPVDAALVSEATNAVGAVCQQELARRVGGVYDAASLTSLLEAKSALSAGAGTPEALASALGSALLGDSRGKLRKARTKLRTRLAKRCGSADLSALFPGVCNASSDVAALADCAAERTLCRHCLAEESARGIDLDCDQLDDALTNASCD
ncbi:MAG: trypsin-like serine protease, partial [Myxococcota bacterium]